MLYVWTCLNALEDTQEGKKCCTLAPHAQSRDKTRSALTALDDMLNHAPWRIHGAGIYSNMTGVYWWDPWSTIYNMDPMGAESCWIMLRLMWATVPAYLALTLCCGGPLAGMLDDGDRTRHRHSHIRKPYESIFTQSQRSVIQNDPKWSKMIQNDPKWSKTCADFIDCNFSNPAEAKIYSTGTWESKHRSQPRSMLHCKKVTGATGVWSQKITRSWEYLPKNTTQNGVAMVQWIS